jgi:hypothetical protein
VARKLADRSRTQPRAARAWPLAEARERALPELWSEFLEAERAATPPAVHTISFRPDFPGTDELLTKARANAREAEQQLNTEFDKLVIAGGIIVTAKPAGSNAPRVTFRPDTWPDVRVVSWPRSVLRLAGQRYRDAMVTLVTHVTHARVGTSGKWDWEEALKRIPADLTGAARKTWLQDNMLRLPGPDGKRPDRGDGPEPETIARKLRDSKPA